MNIGANLDPKEIARFDANASRWWDTQGEFRTLHEINPTRVAYMDERAKLQGKRVLDVGCGGGLAAEGMARLGANVTGIDLGKQTLEVAELHALESGLAIQYRLQTVEEHASQHTAAYDAVSCLEMLEHVPDPVSVLRAIASLVKPGGDVFLSTVNRNVKSYLQAVVSAEYILRLLPAGTHTYANFIKPSELASWSRSVGLEVIDIAGLDYNPLTHRCVLSRYPSVNYLMHRKRP
jgi:2-polyprenyl-6-hydroxyphenyl methylase/3-demethylubiquinone-9 3-methyltransferase